MFRSALSLTRSAGPLRAIRAEDPFPRVRRPIPPYLPNASTAVASAYSISRIGTLTAGCFATEHICKPWSFTDTVQAANGRVARIATARMMRIGLPKPAPDPSRPQPRTWSTSAIHRFVTVETKAADSPGLRPSPDSASGSSLASGASGSGPTSHAPNVPKAIATPALTIKGTAEGERVANASVASS